MNKIVKSAWNNWDKIAAEWFSFLGWVVLLGGLIVLTIYEVLYVRNTNSGYIFLKSAFIVVTSVSSIVLIIYLFKKSYIIAKKIFFPGKSKVLWLIMIIETVSICIFLVGFVLIIALTIKTVPGL